MSINAMTNAAICRRPDFQPAGTIPHTLAENAVAAGAAPRSLTQPGIRAPGEAHDQVGHGEGGISAGEAGRASRAAGPPNGVNTALQTVTTYIPVEVLTLYVAAVAAVGPIEDGDKGREVVRWLPFFVFLVLTPLIVWLVFSAKLRAERKPLPLSPKAWPVWEMLAATVAYAVWAFALPDSPFKQFATWYNPALAGFAVLLVSAALGFLAPLVQRPLAQSSSTPTDAAPPGV